MAKRTLTPQVPGETATTTDTTESCGADELIEAAARPEPAEIPETFSSPILTAKGWLVPEPHQKPKA
jgi:hypothetical protein